ncbi:MAG: DUF554 domain-containing protein [Peptococcaceae bacterium]|nr:DUF554 domain-containing protein [Peptococcaceae bacterium]
MLGTIVNCTTIVCGSLIGSALKKGIPERYKETLIQGMGLAAIALGLNSALSRMPESDFPVLFIASLALGGLIGEILNLDSLFQKGLSKISVGNSNLSEGLSTAILLFCVGTLSILGPMQSALQGDNTFLYTNAMLDLVTSMVFAANYGFGIAFAAVVLFFWQGFFYCFAHLIADFVTGSLLTELSIIGGILIFCSGLGILGIKKIRTVNYLPALLVPAAYIGLLQLFQ